MEKTSDWTVAGFHVLPFEWRPPKGPAQCYAMENTLDQHRILLHPDVKKGAAYPVVVGFHGQPKRGKNPRDYKFHQGIEETLVEVMREGGTKPFVLVLPVFRFNGQNWPGFDPASFRTAVEAQLTSIGVRAGGWYAFGHSGAAGCGGDGLNMAHRLEPKAVGFFDTCLGKGWQAEIGRLRKKGIRTINIHSVETAGFRPKQRPEYQSNFDFGRAYKPLGMKPVSCSNIHPGEELRDQPYRCAATDDGWIGGFVVDTGEGQAAHEALLRVALRYFLLNLVGLSR